MLINGKPQRTVFLDDNQTITIIDQTKLPFTLEYVALATFDDACTAIQTMQVRGAPAIGAVAAYAMVLAVKHSGDWGHIVNAAHLVKDTRPTAVNLAWAVDKQLAALQNVSTEERLSLAWQVAAQICEDDVLACSAIGDFGLELIQTIAANKQNQTINILTHCNAGWLATVDWGTALAPIYKAHAKGLDIHVWVDETRPRNQGALLTAFEYTQGRSLTVERNTFFVKGLSSYAFTISVVNGVVISANLNRNVFDTQTVGTNVATKPNHIAHTVFPNPIQNHQFQI